MAGSSAWGVLGLAYWGMWPGPGIADYGTRGVPGLVLAHWWMGKPLALIGQREDSKMVIAITNVLVVEQAPQNGCCQYVCAQRESKWLPVSPGGSPRLANGSNQGSFQITASLLGLGACVIL